MADKKLHIAIISSWFPTPSDTAGIFASDQADALINAGNKVSVFMFQYISPMVWLKKKIKGEPLNRWLKGKYVTPLAYDFINFIPTRFYSDPNKAQKKAFLKYIEKSFKTYISTNGKPDIIHHHGVANYCYLTDFISKRFNIPYVITEHSMFLDKIDHFNSYETDEERMDMIRHASVRMAVSKFYAEHNSALFGVPFIVMPNMINNDFANIPLPAFPKKIAPFNFLNIGEYAQRKRQDLLIESFTNAFKGNRDVHLTIVGYGKLEQELKKLIASLGMNEQIHLPGYTKKNEVIQLMDKSHVIVISSEKESFSMVAAESLFRGNPVLTTRCKGPEDFINSTNGLTCEVNNITDMQNKLVDIYKKYASFNYTQIAEEVKSHFSEQVIVSRLEDLYRKVISSSSPLAGKGNGNQ